MKGTLLVMIATALLLVFAGMALAESDMQKVPSCTYCGMDRTRFAHSRMFVTFDDGTIVGTCSIHCLAIDLATSIDKTPESIQVGDFNHKNLIDVENAFWVIGGDKSGVMTRQAKWAFATKDEAENFIAESGGKLATFDEAMQATYVSMYADVKMLREKRKKMRMKMQTKGAAHQ